MQTTASCKEAARSEIVSTIFFEGDVVYLIISTGTIVGITLVPENVQFRNP
jgi:hypothetical protein